MSRNTNPGAKPARAADDAAANPRPKTASSEALRRAYEAVVKHGLI